MVGPVQFRGKIRGCRIAGLVTKQRAVVHARRPDDPVRIQHSGWVERVLHRFERADDSRSKHLVVELAAHQPVAVLAAVGALVFAHEVETFLRHRAHGGDVGGVLHAQDRADMQAPHGGVGVPRALCAMPREHIVQAIRVIGEVVQIDGAVLDEGHRFAVAFHRHHDVQAGFAHRRDIRLKSWIDGTHDVGMAQVGHQGFQLVQLGV